MRKASETIRRSGVSSIAVDKPTRDMVNILAAKAGIPVYIYIKQLAADDAKNKQLTLPGQGSLVSEASLGSIAKKVSDTNSLMLGCMATSIAIIKAGGIKDLRGVDMAVFSEIEARIKETIQMPRAGAKEGSQLNMDGAITA